MNNELHRLAAWFFSGVIVVWLAAMIFVFATAQRPDEGRVAVVFPPSTSNEQAIAVGSSVGTFIADGEQQLEVPALVVLAGTATAPDMDALSEFAPQAEVEVMPNTGHFLLTLKAPVCPIGSGALYDLVSDRLRAIDASLKPHGPHSLRHACAVHLLAEGLSMKEIGDHLGHRKLDTTRVYAKVDLAGLRQVADFDIGGVL